jgi:hypothetical protein
VLSRGEATQENLLALALGHGTAGGGGGPINNVA